MSWVWNTLEVELFPTHWVVLLLGLRFDINLSVRHSWHQKQKCACNKAMKKTLCVRVWIQLISNYLQSVPRPNPNIKLSSFLPKTFHIHRAQYGWPSLQKLTLPGRRKSWFATSPVLIALFFWSVMTLIGQGWSTQQQQVHIVNILFWMPFLCTISKCQWCQCTLYWTLCEPCIFTRGIKETGQLACITMMRLHWHHCKLQIILPIFYL